MYFLKNNPSGEAQHHVPHARRQGRRRQGAAVPGNLN